MTGDGFDGVNGRIVACEACPRLRGWCREVAREKRAAFRGEEYWGRPVPNFGDPEATGLIVGLAPAAHGANRTGRMFTGDRSGDFLYAALHRAGLANQPSAVSRDDGLHLKGVYITAALRCAPPANKPTPGQLANCRAFLLEEITTLKPRVILCLGAIGWNAALRAIETLEFNLTSPRPRFSHGAELRAGRVTMIGCYHVSQQNTFTGRLTESMIDRALARAKALA